MRFKHYPKRTTSLESVALTDIVMNLFLFFFITFNLFSTFQASRESPLKVNLPTISKGPAAPQVLAHEIFLKKTGEIFWDQSTIAMDELRIRLKSQDTKTKPISLRADRDASVQGLVNILEIVRDAGITNASLQTKIADSKTSS